MLWDQALLAVPVILASAAFLRSTFGFGDALLAMPLLLFFVPAESASVIVAAIGCLQGLIMLLQERRAIDLGMSSRLILGAVLGVPLGIFGLVHLPGQWIKYIISSVLLIYALQVLLNLKLPRLESTRWGILAGACAGCLGAAFNTSGPPVVLYGAMAQWKPEQFRVTLQSFFFPLSLMIVAGHLVSGLWTTDNITLIALAVPGLLAGIGLGTLCRGHIPAESFKRALCLVLIVLAVLLAW